MLLRFCLILALYGWGAAGQAPICIAPTGLTGICKNHRIDVTLSQDSLNYQDITWSLPNDHAGGVTLSNPSSFTPILKIDPALCLDEVEVSITVSNDLGSATCNAFVQLSYFNPVLDGLDDEDLTLYASCEDIPPIPYVLAKDDCDVGISLDFWEEEEDDLIKRIWEATNVCGDTTKKVQKIHIVDETAPYLVGVEPDETVECDEVPPPCIVYAYDNCDSDLTVDFQAHTILGTCEQEYKVLYTWTATDDHGNTVTETQTIFVVDTEDPYLVGVPEDDTVSCRIYDAALPLGMDACDDDVDVVATEKTIDTTCTHEYTVERKWTVTDNCGNYYFDTQTITVEDSSAPIFSEYPVSLTVHCDNDIPPCILVVNDECDDYLTAVQSDVSEEGTCEDERTIYRTWLAVDDCGNEAKAEQTVWITDDVAPHFVGVPPGELHVICDNIPQFQLTAVDDCDKHVIVHLDETTDKTDPNQSCDYAIYRKWSAEDNCGNAIETTQTIYVSDPVSPTLFGVPPAVTYECDLIPTIDEGTVSAVDNCECDPMLVVDSDSTIGGTCEHSYKLVRQWKVTDCCGNEVVETQTITVEDTTPPVISAVQNLEMTFAEWEEASEGDDFGTIPVATDNCADATVTWHTSYKTNTCQMKFDYLRTFTAVDECGNSDSTVQTIKVDDIVPPHMNCIADYTLECDEVPDFTTDPILSGTAVTATDDSSHPLPAISFNLNKIDGTCDDEYQIVLTWEVADICGNKADCVTTVTVRDIEAPQWTVVPPVSVTVDDCHVPQAHAEAEDSCSTVTISFDEQTTNPNECENDFVVTREWQVVDECGNNGAVIYQTIKVPDNKAPIIIVDTPDDETVDCDYTASGAPTATDDSCFDNQTVIVPVYSENILEQNGCPHDYTLERTWTFSDCVGNPMTTTQTITVVDDTAPVIAVKPDDVEFTCTQNAHYSVSATDNCDNNVHCSEETTIVSQTCAYDWTKQYIWTCNDECGNTDSHTFSVHVVDDGEPTITIPPDAVINCDEDYEKLPGSCVDGCVGSSAAVVEEPAPWTSHCDDTIIRTFTCADECHTVSAVQTITIVDNEAPTFDSLPQDEDLECGETYQVPTLSGHDNCGEVTLTKTFKHYDGDHCGSSTDIFTWTLTDECGNVEIAYNTITYNDNTPPSITCPSDKEVECDGDDDFGEVTYSDACCPPTLVHTDTINPGTCDTDTVKIRTFTVCDEAEHCESCAQTITVHDTQPPELTPESSYTSFTTPPESIPVSALCSDACDSDVLPICTDNVDEGCSGDDYTIIRHCHCEDDCGHLSDTGTSTYNVIDKTSCEWETTPSDFTIECGEMPADFDGTHTNYLETTGPTTVDPNCIVNSSGWWNADYVTGSSCPWIYTYDYTSWDECANTDSWQRTTYVHDTTPPVINEDLEDRTEPCEYSFDTVTATDECAFGFATVTSAEEHPEGEDIHIIVYTATDDCGNTATETQTVTVKDVTTPTLVVVPDDRTVCIENIPPVGDANVVCQDDCDELSSSFSETTVDGSCEFENVVERCWECIDLSGNANKECQYITVQDCYDPVFVNCPEPTVIYVLEEDIPPAPLVEATDNTGSVTVTYTETKDYDHGLEGIVYIIHRHWTAVDECGNNELCDQWIYIEVPPTPITFCCPAQHVPATCEDEPISDLYDSLEVALGKINECTHDNFTITGGDWVTTQGTCPSEYTKKRCFTITDPVLGNSTECCEEYVVSDDGPPKCNNTATLTFPCPNVHSVQPECSDCGDVTTTETYAGSSLTGRYTFVSTDECGHEVTNYQDIIFTDNTPPTLEPVPEQYIQLTCEFEAQPVPIPTDDCCEVYSTNHSTTVPSSCPGRSTTYNRWHLTDCHGNTADYYQTITVVDDGMPTLVGPAPADLEIYCDDDLPELPELPFVDNCFNEVRKAVYKGQTQEDGPPVIIIRSWGIEDDCGNTPGDIYQTITITDPEPPTIIGVPEDETVECEGCVCGEVTATDNCGEPTIEQSDETEEGTCEHNYVVITTWTATDGSGLTTTKTHRLTVEDNHPPVITGVPPAATVECDEVPIVVDGSVTATDKCDPNVDLTMTEQIIYVSGVDVKAGETFEEYTLVRVWTATDDCGNTATLEQSIHVTDSYEPTWDIGPFSDKNLKCGETYEVPVVTASDRCTEVTVVPGTSSTEGTCPGNEQYVYTWDATDTVGNSGHAEMTVTYTDDTPPYWTSTPAKNVFEQCDPPAMVAPVCEDLCGDATVTPFTDPVNGASCNDDTWVRHWTCSDQCGNSITTDQTVKIEDTEGPTCVTCAGADYGVETCTPETVDDEWFTAVTWTDNCGPVTDQCTIAKIWSENCDADYRQTCTASDECGNAATPEVQVVGAWYYDTPVFADHEDTINVECGVAPVLPSPTATSECNTPNVNYVGKVLDDSTDCTTTYIHQWTASGDCSYDVDTYVTVVITDSTPPEITVGGDRTIDCKHDGHPDIPHSVFDDCDQVITPSEPHVTFVAGSCPHEGSWNYHFSAVDECGNEANEYVTVTFGDNEPPTAVIPVDVTVECDDIPDPLDVTPHDNCAELATVNRVTDEYPATPEEYPALKHIVYTFTITDSCGNVFVDSYKVTVVDTTDPVITSPEATDKTVQCDDETIAVVPSVTCSDVCDQNPQITFTDEVVEGTCTEYLIKRSWKCVDGTGHSVEIDQVVDVLDNGVPAFDLTGNDPVTHQCDETYEPQRTFKATDDCDGDLTVSATETIEGTIEDDCEQVILRDWTATDTCGNTISESETVTLVDTTPPYFINVPIDVTAECDNIAAVIPTPPTAGDNCADVSVSTDFERTTGICDNQYYMIYTYTVQDTCNPRIEERRTITVHDTTPPVLHGVPTTTTGSIVCGHVDIAPPTVTATDNCGEVTLDLSSTEQPYQFNFGCDNEYKIIHHWFAYDPCGNEVSDSVTYYFVDDSAPELTTLDDVTMECDEFTDFEPCHPKPICIEDADLDIIMTTVMEDHANYYDHIVTWNITDCAGNWDSTSQTVTVIDEQKPILTRYPEDETVECECTDFPYPPSIKAIDNCDEVTVVFQEDSEMGTCEDEYFLYRHWSASDSNGHTVDHHQTISVHDTTPPEFCDDPRWLYQKVRCHYVDEPEMAIAKDTCDEDVLVQLVEPVQTIDGSCEHSYTLIYTYVATDNCGNTAELFKTLDVVDNLPPTNGNGPTICVMPEAGEEWGIYAVYPIAELFHPNDNCDKPSDIDIEYLTCNATDSSINGNPLTASTSHPDWPLECMYVEFGVQKLIYVKVEHHVNQGSAPYIGRSYHIWARFTDDCGNSDVHDAQVFIPYDNTILARAQPCESGDPNFLSNLPNGYN